jgi:hypothetical protein
MESRVCKHEPFWAVGPACKCLLITPVRYVGGGKENQLGLQVDCMHRRPFFFMSPLFIKVLDELSIGTDAREPVLEPALDVVKQHFHASKVAGTFTSGPITALFPYSESDSALKCLHNEKVQPEEEVKSEVLEVHHKDGPVIFFRNKMELRLEWELKTVKVLSNLVSHFGLPLLRFRTYEEASERCHMQLH